eukprot:RCo050431
MVWRRFPGPRLLQRSPRPGLQPGLPVAEGLRPVPQPGSPAGYVTVLLHCLGSGEMCSGLHPRACPNLRSTRGPEGFFPFPSQATFVSAFHAGLLFFCFRAAIFERVLLFSDTGRWGFSKRFSVWTPFAWLGLRRCLLLFAASHGLFEVLCAFFLGVLHSYPSRLLPYAF